MTSVERYTAARYEAQRYVAFSIEEAIVRVYPLERGTHLWAVGVARASALKHRIDALRKARLKAVAVDHESYALGRALEGFDAIVDIGHHRSTLHVVSGPAPLTLQAYSGGADITRAIERELSVDNGTAEKRKRIVGTAGAGESAKAALVSDIAALVARARLTHRVTRIALVGNGARLAGLAGDIETAIGLHVEIPVAGALHAGAYPQDVARSAGPDWALATGLALWKQP
jgi:Tfp pilus assembly PilM family ATPase